MQESFYLVNERRDCIFVTRVSEGTLTCVCGPMPAVAAKKKEESKCTYWFYDELNQGEWGLWECEELEEGDLEEYRIDG